MANSLSLHSSLLALTALHTIAAVQFAVINDATKSTGGIRFTEEIGVDYAKQTMETTTNFIWLMFNQTDATDRKNIDQVSIIIKNYSGAEATTYGETITVSALYLEGYKGNLMWEFTSLMYHEMTHVWQWNGAGGAPDGLIEGVADYTVLESGYNPPGFAKPGMGERWDQGYDFTARFLEYCDGVQAGFVAALNRKMRESFSVEYFDELLGKSVDQVWSEYKGFYGGGGGKRGGGERRGRKWGDYKARYGEKEGDV